MALHRGDPRRGEGDGDPVKVYAVHKDVPYEFGFIVKVFDTEEKAIKFAQEEWNLKGPPKKGYEDDYPYWARPGQEITIQEWEVE